MSQMFFVDTFTGTNGTALVGHVANSGATWQANIAGTAPAYLDGSGGVYSTSAGAGTILISNQTRAPSLNFSVFFGIKRLTAAPSGAFSAGVLCTCVSGTWAVGDFALQLVDTYSVNTKFGLENNASTVASTTTVPSVGTLWYIRMDVSTPAGGNTTFTAYYSTTWQGPWNALLSYTTPAALSTSQGVIGYQDTGSTAVTSTTGIHVYSIIQTDLYGAGAPRKVV